MRPTTTSQASPQSKATAPANAKVMYTGKTHTTGGPSGATKSADGFLDLKLSAPHGPHLRLTDETILAGANARPLRLTVNGAVIEPSVNFAPTGGASVWQEITATVALVAGANTVQLTSIGSGGGNFDQLSVAPVDPISAVLSQLRRPISPEMRSNPNPPFRSRKS